MTQPRWTLPEEEYHHPGNFACPGCGERIAQRIVLKTLGPKTIVVLVASCATVIDGLYPLSASKVPVFNSPFMSGAVIGAGMRAGLDKLGQQDVTVLVWAGDGGTFDIGMQALSGAAERNDRMVYICYDNEAYMNTGVQRSSATPQLMSTTTSPGQARKMQPKKDLVGIMAAHAVPYAATAVVGYPEDLAAKVRRARDAGGFSLIHVLSPCPTGWRSLPSMTPHITRLAVRSRLFPLYEVVGGRVYHVQEAPYSPLEEYVRLQGRYDQFSSGDIALVEQWIDERWNDLMQRATSVSALPGQRARRGDHSGPLPRQLV